MVKKLFSSQEITEITEIIKSVRPPFKCNIKIRNHQDGEPQELHGLRSRTDSVTAKVSKTGPELSVRGFNFRDAPLQVFDDVGVDMIELRDVESEDGIQTRDKDTAVFGVLLRIALEEAGFAVTGTLND